MANVSAEGKFSYMRARNREEQLHPGKGNGNAVTSGQGKGKCSYIRGNKKGNAVTSGQGKGKCSEIRGKEMGKPVTSGGTKREMQLRSGGVNPPSPLTKQLASQSFSPLPPPAPPSPRRPPPLPPPQRSSSSWSSGAFPVQYPGCRCALLRTLKTWTRPSSPAAYPALM